MPNQVNYGFVDLTDVWGERVTTVGLDLVNRAIQETVAEHNRQVDALTSLFLRRITDFQLRYRTASVARLQGLDEFGRARPIRQAGHYDVAFPLQFAGIAWGADFVAKTKMTVAEANEYTTTLINADLRWVRDHILAALFANVAWPWADPEHGALIVQGLANGDAVRYQILTGADSAATDTHYLAQAAAIADASNPYPVAHDEILEHPENSGDIVHLIPTNLLAATEALTLFFPIADPRIRRGANTDELIATLGVTVPGEVVGYVEDGGWICHWRSMPSNYIVSVATGGDRALAMREDPEPELRGFRLAAEREDHPFWEAQYIRRAGFGGWNRVGATVTRIGNAAYAIPTNYTNPMP
jgi:hypothetical protein